MHLHPLSCFLEVLLHLQGWHLHLGVLARTCGDRELASSDFRFQLSSPLYIIISPTLRASLCVWTQVPFVSPVVRSEQKMEKLGFLPSRF